MSGRSKMCSNLRTFGARLREENTGEEAQIIEKMEGKDLQKLRNSEYIADVDEKGSSVAKWSKNRISLKHLKTDLSLKP